MYKVSYFHEPDEARVIRFMREYPFAIVSGMGDRYPVVSHIPLIVKQKEDGKIILEGHIMRNTDHHKAWMKNEYVLAVFSGPHAYISASWYEEPQVASTWNYMTVHAKGTLRFLDEAGTIRIIDELTQQYEAASSLAAFSKIPDDYVNKLVKAITGFEIEVESLENVFELSQNRSEAARKVVMQQLNAGTDSNAIAIAEAMAYNEQKSNHDKN